MKKLFIFTIVLILFSSFVSAALLDDILANWDFNTDGATQTDNTGNASNDLTETGSVTHGPMVILDGAYYAGSNDFFTASSVLVGTGSKSFSWWGNVSNSATFQVLFDNDKGSSGARCGTRAFYNAGTLIFDIRNGAGAGEYLVTTVAQTSNTINHWCAVFDAAVPSLKLYKDGVLSSTDLISSGSECIGTTNFRIGADANDTTNDFTGSTDDLSIWTRPLTGGECLELFNDGNGLPFPFVNTIFNLTLINEYNSSSIDTFTANITNSSNPTGTTIHTTNGTINYPTEQIIDIFIFNVTGSEGVYFNRTLTNINSTVDTEAETWQSVLILSATDTVGSLILNFNASASADFNQFNISNSTGNVTFHLNTQEYNITGRAENYNDNATLSINTTAVNFTFGVLTFPLNMINITAVDKQNNNVINNFNASINGGLFFNTTTIGWMVLPCPTPTCDIDINSSLFIPQSFTGHNANNDFQANLSNRTNSFFFVNTNDGLPLVSANITISSPLGRSLERITDANGRIEFDSMLGDAFDQGNYSITLQAFLGFITPITFNRIINFTTAPENTTFNISTANINVNIFDRESGLLLTGVSVNVFALTLFNQSTDNGTINIQNVTIVPNTYIFQAIATGFGTEQKSVIYNGQSNITIDFFMLNLTGINTGNLFLNVIDTFYRVQPDSLTKLFEYDEVTQDFIVISECITNSNGECQYFIELNIKTYFITGSKVIGGVNFSDTTPAEVIKTDNEIRNLFLKIATPDNLRIYDGVGVSAIDLFNSTWNILNLSQIVAFFSVDDGTSREVCIEYLREDVTESLDCQTSSGGIITSSVLSLNRSFNYEARVFLIAPTLNYTYYEFDFPADTSLESLFGEDNLANPLIIFGWVLLLGLGFRLKSISGVVGVLGIFLAWGELSLFPSILMVTGAVLKTVICGVIIWAGRRRTDIS